MPVSACPFRNIRSAGEVDQQMGDGISGGFNSRMGILANLQGSESASDRSPAYLQP